MTNQAAEPAPLAKPGDAAICARCGWSGYRSKQSGLMQRHRVDAPGGPHCEGGNPLDPRSPAAKAIQRRRVERTGSPA